MHGVNDVYAAPAAMVMVMAMVMMAMAMAMDMRRLSVLRGLG